MVPTRILFYASSGSKTLLCRKFQKAFTTISFNGPLDSKSIHEMDLPWDVVIIENTKGIKNYFQLALSFAIRGLQVVVCSARPNSLKYKDPLKQARIPVVRTADLAADYIRFLRIKRRSGIDLAHTGGAITLVDPDSLIPAPIVNMLRIELPLALQRSRLIETAEDLFGTTEHSVAEIFIGMRAARLAAQLELEAKAFNLCISLEKKTLGPIVWKPLDRTTLDLGAADAVAVFESLAELAQGQDTYISIDPLSTCVRGIYRFETARPNMRYHYFKELTNTKIPRIVIYVPGNNTAELYATGLLLFKFDGFSWHDLPLFLMEATLGTDFKCDSTVLMEAVVQLSSERASSIIAYDPSLFENPNVSIQFQGMREHLRITGRSVSGMTVEELKSILKLDGVHLLNPIDGTFIKVAQKVTIEATGGSLESGTGRKVARDLSAAFPDSAVIKISASGGRVTMFRNGLPFPNRRPYLQF